VIATFWFAGSLSLIGLALAAAAMRRGYRAPWFAWSQAALLLPVFGLVPLGSLCALAFGLWLLVRRREFVRAPVGSPD
jgi:uncharacterized membrane protein